MLKVLQTLKWVLVFLILLVAKVLGLLPDSSIVFLLFSVLVAGTCVWELFSGSGGDFEVAADLFMLFLLVVYLAISLGLKQTNWNMFWVFILLSVPGLAKAITSIKRKS